MAKKKPYRRRVKDRQTISIYIDTALLKKVDSLKLNRSAAVDKALRKMKWF